VGIDSNKLQNFNNSQQGLLPSNQQQFNPNSNQVLNFNSTPRHKDIKQNGNGSLGSFQQGGEPTLAEVV